MGPCGKQLPPIRAAKPPVRPGRRKRPAQKCREYLSGSLMAAAPAEASAPASEETLDRTLVVRNPYSRRLSEIPTPAGTRQCSPTRFSVIDDQRSGTTRVGGETLEGCRTRFRRAGNGRARHGPRHHRPQTIGCPAGTGMIDIENRGRVGTVLVETAKTQPRDANREYQSRSTGKSPTHRSAVCGSIAKTSSGVVSINAYSPGLDGAASLGHHRSAHGDIAVAFCTRSEQRALSSPKSLGSGLARHRDCPGTVRATINLASACSITKFLVGHDLSICSAWCPARPE